MMNRAPYNKRLQAGNIFFMLFAGVALVGAIGVGASNQMKGLVTSMSDVTRKTIAEEKMMGGARLSVMDATVTQDHAGDCDNDGMIEPIQYRDAGTKPKPVGGGYLPLEIGASTGDPWGTEYGYCVWDPGTTSVSDNNTDCGGTTARRLQGPKTNSSSTLVIAVISAGKDRKFSTTCNAYNPATPGAPLVGRSSAGDDIILEYTYADADGLSGEDLWKIRDTKPDTAMINKNIEVTGGAKFTGALDLMKKGLLLPADPGNNSVTGACTVTNKDELRINIGQSPPVLEICFNNAWVPISMGAGADDCGKVWAPQTATQANTWTSVTYGNGVFVAVAASGTNQVMTSPDGITWTARTAAEANQWSSVTFGNGVFVAVALTGTNQVMTSPDGITWTTRAPSHGAPWRSVTYGNGLFVAVTYSGGTNRVMTSPDGITWTARTAAEANYWYSVTYGKGMFVAVSENGTNRVMTSTDGITWTARTAAEANQWQSVTYGKGVFVAVSKSGTNGVMTSPDGITWTARTAAEANGWQSVTYGNGLFVAVGAAGTNRVMASTDGITWTPHMAAQANNWYSVAYGNGLFVAVTQGGTNRVMTSTCSKIIEEEEEEEEEEELDTKLPEPVAQYQLDENSGTTIMDSTGGLSGTLSGAGNPSSLLGKAGRAIKFDGTDDRVAIPVQTKISALTAMTISGWIKQDVNTGNQFIYTTRSSGALGFTILTQASGRLRFEGGAGGGWNLDNALNGSTWTHFAITYDATSPTTAPVFYINGAAAVISSGTLPASYATGSGAGWIGATPSGVNYFNGALDDIRVYGSVLNPAQISRLYLDRPVDVNIAPNPAVVMGSNPYSFKLAFGNSYVNAIKPDGTLWLWGSYNGPNKPAPIPMGEPAGQASPWIQVSGTCGLKANGSAWCWGANLWGELGNGTTGVAAYTTPVPVSGGHKFKKISGNHQTTCALRDDARIMCWGIGSQGRMGNGADANSLVPVLVSDVGPWVDVSSRGASCGIKADGSAWCWGPTGGSGQLGNGDKVTVGFNIPVPVAEPGPWVRISKGGTHTCGIKNDGTAWCWGYNNNGELGAGTTADPGVPVRVTDAGPWKDIFAGAQFGNSCGIKMDGTAWCWGTDTYGELGNGTEPATYIPTPLADPGPWAYIDKTNSVGCGIKTDGSAWCWGYDSGGLLGNGAITGNFDVPTKVENFPDPLHFTFNDAQTLLTKNPAATSFSLGTNGGRIGYDGTSGGFGYTGAGRSILSNPLGSSILSIETTGTFDAQISLKALSAANTRSIGVDSANGNLEFGLNNAGVTNTMSAIAPQMSLTNGGKVILGSGATASAKLDISTGGLKIGDDTRNCSISRRGVLRYGGTKFEYCDGSAWKDF